MTWSIKSNMDDYAEAEGIGAAIQKFEKFRDVLEELAEIADGETKYASRYFTERRNVELVLGALRNWFHGMTDRIQCEDARCESCKYQASSYEDLDRHFREEHTDPS